MKRLTIQLSDAEYAGLKTLADDEGVSVSAIIRARLGFPYQRRGAPKGNTNRGRRQHQTTPRKQS